MNIDEKIEKYLNEGKSINDLPEAEKKGLLGWVDDYKKSRTVNVKLAKEIKSNIDKQIKKYGLNPKEVYGDK